MPSLRHFREIRTASLLCGIARCNCLQTARCSRWYRPAAYVILFKAQENAAYAAAFPRLPTQHLDA